MTRLLLIPGSLRRESFNARLLQHIETQFFGACELDFLDPREVKLPLFDQDLEDGPELSRIVTALHTRFARCDGFIVASPEYNGQLTAYLKNVVDWVSRVSYIRAGFENPFCDRPVLLCSASTGALGGQVGVAHARALFGYVGALVIGDTLCVPNAHEAWSDEVGFVFNDYFEERIASATHRVFILAQDYSLRRQGAALFA